MFSLTWCQRSANSYAPETCIFKRYISLAENMVLTLRKSEHSKMFEKTFIHPLSSIIHNTTKKNPLNFFFINRHTQHLQIFHVFGWWHLFSHCLLPHNHSEVCSSSTYLLLELAARSNLSFQELKANKHFLRGEAGSRSTLLIHVRSFPGPTKLHTNGNDTPKKKSFKYYNSHTLLLKGWIRIFYQYMKGGKVHGYSETVLFPLPLKLDTTCWRTLVHYSSLY